MIFINILFSNCSVYNFYTEIADFGVFFCFGDLPIVHLRPKN